MASPRATAASPCPGLLPSLEPQKTPTLKVAGPCPPGPVAMAERSGGLGVAAGQPLIVVHQRAGDRSELVMQIVDRAHRRDLRRRAGHEDLLRVGQLLGADMAFDDIDPALARELDHRAARNAVEEAVRRRRVDLPTDHEK